MDVYEYQAQGLLKEYGVPVLDGRVATTAAEAREAACSLGFPVVFKAQVHAGGRGKAGGVRVVKSEAEAEAIAQAILALTVKGLPVRKLWVVPAAVIAAEAYLSLLIDRRAERPVFIGCAAGGVEIEETARTNPEAILRLELGDSAPQASEPDRFLPLAERLFTEPGSAAAVVQVMAGMERLLWARDCSLVEINPLVRTGEGAVIALDAKISLDDNALFRHQGNQALRDRAAEDPAEIRAREAGLSFVGLDGDIGCMVNGAGLAMATLDTLQHFGGSPANFLDVGGSSNPQKIITAFEIILQNPRVKVILINIFGGITRCDDVARGLLAALREFQVNVPIVVRLTGTNEQQARQLLAGDEILAGKAVTTPVSLEDAAEKAVQIAVSS